MYCLVLTEVLNICFRIVFALLCIGAVTNRHE